MTPGVNDGQRNTGTLPKSNRSNDRNREVITSNEQSIRSPYYHGRPQHSNNLLDWQPVSDRESLRTTKNSNTRSILSAPYQDFTDIITYGGNRQHNYSGEDYTQWQEMTQPVDLRAQSPHIQGAKPMNVDRMPDRHQVESRLNQIREYIRVTSTMMESLSQSSDPRARTQHEKLSRMVEDLCDSETKLAKLLENYRGPISESNNHPSQSSNQMKRFAELLDILSSQEHLLSVNRRNDEYADGEESVESQLRKKMEASQRKLVELQDHQANLIGMQLRVRERLNEARQAQQALLLQENQGSNVPNSSPAWDTENRPQQQLANDAEVLESETAALKGKLVALQSKKKQMDTLVAELQAVEMSDRASCSSDNPKYVERDKVVELETLKQQLAHLKGLLEEATRVRDNCNPTLEQPEAEYHPNAISYDNSEALEENVGAGASYNSCDRNSDNDVYSKFNNSTERLTVDQIQAVTRELKEQQVLLQSARAELQRLKNPSTQSTSLPPAPALLMQGTTPPSSLASAFGGDKKTSNNISTNGDSTHGKKRHHEEFIRKDTSQSSVNRDSGGVDWSSRRGSNSQLSHANTPANMWPVPNPAVVESNEQSIDGISTAENLLDIGPQITTIENGCANNWWSVPTAPPMAPTSNVGGHAGSVEYYRQLLMGSQAQQLQTMSTTLQQCCQLLWSQQRELQSMRAAIIQLQQHLRQTQNPPPIANNDSHEDYSNLSRSTHLGNTLDASLPPSSSLPNLVSLPTATSASSHSPVVTSTNPQQHHQNNQQLNNQVPPGNRANNYWDNFRSYSRQNLLSGNSKTVTDLQPGPSSNSSISTNTAATSVHASLVRDKRNREHGVTDNISLPSVSSSDAQYSLNLQLPSSNLQEREISATRHNILSNEAAQSQQVENFWEEAHSSFRLVPESNDDIYSLRHLSGEMRDVLLSLIAANRQRPDYLVIILREIKAISGDQRLRPRLLRSLRALHDTQSPNNQLNETVYQTASESCQSSDDDSDMGAQASPLLNSNAEHQPLISEFTMLHHSTMQGPSIPALLADHFEFEGPAQLEHPSIILGSSLTPGYNEDLAEADQSRPEASTNQQNSLGDDNDILGENNEAHAAFVSHNASILETDREVSDGENGNGDEIVVDNSLLDRIPTRLLHH